MSDRIDLNGPQYQRPEDRGNPYEIKKDGKDPWRDHPAKVAASWLFWLAMLYFATAGFVYGALTGREEKRTPLTETYFAPAEFLRGWSTTYRGITDWQISLFRDPREQPAPLPRPPGPGF